MTYDQLPTDIQDFFKWSWVQCPSYRQFQKKLQGDNPITVWLNDSFRWGATEDKHDVWEEIDDLRGNEQINAICKTKFYAQFLKSRVPFNPQAIQDMRHAIEELPI